MPCNALDISRAIAGQTGHSVRVYVPDERDNIADYIRAALPFYLPLSNS
jgi:hypothetical protein